MKLEDVPSETASLSSNSLQVSIVSVVSCRVVRRHGCCRRSVLLYSSMLSTMIFVVRRESIRGFVTPEVSQRSPPRIIFEM